MCKPWFIATFILPQHPNTTLRKSPKHHCAMPVSPPLSLCHGDQAGTMLSTSCFSLYLTPWLMVHGWINTSISDPTWSTTTVTTNNLNISIIYPHQHGYIITTSLSRPHLLSTMSHSPLPGHHSDSMTLITVSNTTTITIDDIVLVNSTMATCSHLPQLTSLSPPRMSQHQDHMSPPSLPLTHPCPPTCEGEQSFLLKLTSPVPTFTWTPCKNLVWEEKLGLVAPLPASRDPASLGNLLPLTTVLPQWS